MMTELKSASESGLPTATYILAVVSEQGIGTLVDGKQLQNFIERLRSKACRPHSFAWELVLLKVGLDRLMKPKVLLG